MGSSRDSRSFGSGVEEGMSMGTTITRSISRKATYQLVKIYEKDKVQHAIFRLYDDGSLNYHDIELKKLGKEVKIADMFIYASGEYFSETIKGLYEQLQGVKDNKGIKGNAFNWASKLAEMKTLMTQGQTEEALAVYEGLPGEIKQMRAIQIMHVMIASGLDDLERYNDAIEEYKTLYPNEPNMQLLLLDGYFIKKEYDKALAGINEIDKMINKDPFLDYYRYLTYNMLEDKEKAKACLLRVMKVYPDFQDGMMQLIITYINEEDKKEANVWIEKYRMTSAFDQQELKNTLIAAGYETE